MSYNNGGYPPSNSRFNHPSNHAQAPPLTTSPDFDILDWHPAYESCQRYFVDYAQHEPGTQALCALINIRLPFQRPTSPSQSTFNNPGPSSYGNQGQWSRPSPSPSSRSNTNHSSANPTFVSLVPYIRRLVITGFDKPGILHGFFGDAYHVGITPLQDCERRNYLFAAKHGGWRMCKMQYDMNAEETVPFLKPLQSVRSEELEAAEKSWSSWLQMEDWMIGPREPAPNDEEDGDPFQHRRQDGPSWAQRGFGFDSGLPDGVPEH